jgi:hypothetical protein
VGRWIMIGVAVLAAIIFLPGLLSGGKGGAVDAGRGAGDAAIDTVKDPGAVVDGAGKAIAPVKEVATPWWEFFIAQPWAIPAIIAGVGALLLIRMWNNMGPKAQKTAVGIGVAVVILVAVGMASAGR